MTINRTSFLIQPAPCLWPCHCLHTVLWLSVHKFVPQRTWQKVSPTHTHTHTHSHIDSFKPLANSFLICLASVYVRVCLVCLCYCPRPALWLHPLSCHLLFVWCVNVFSLAFIILFPFPQQRKKNFLLAFPHIFQHLFSM